VATESATRVVVIGNSGSGKSTIAARIGAALTLPVHDLDALRWLSPGEARPGDEAKALVAQAAAGDGWVIEGVWAGLLEVALVRATALVWLDLSWDECLQGLVQRGPHYGYDPMDRAHAAALADAHRERLPGQAQLYRDFSLRKIHLRTRQQVTAFTADGLRE
jgi:adenylate kinase family enzyme